MSGPYRRHLDVVRVSSPCTEDWWRMEGDETVRFCGKCSSNVYDLSALTLVEAEKLLSLHEGRICVRLHRRKDGTLVTADCTPARSAARESARRRTILAAVLACVSIALTAIARWPAARTLMASKHTGEPIPIPQVEHGRIEMGGILGVLETLEGPPQGPTWVDPATIDLSPSE